MPYYKDGVQVNNAELLFLMLKKWEELSKTEGLTGAFPGLKMAFLIKDKKLKAILYAAGGREIEPDFEYFRTNLQGENDLEAIMFLNDFKQKYPQIHDNIIREQSIVLA